MRKYLSILFLIALLAMMGLNVRPVMAGDTPPPYNPFDVGLNWKWNVGKTFTWEIVKSADQTHLTLSEGQLFPVNYTVTVKPTAHEEGLVVRGDFRIQNDDPTLPLTINYVKVTQGFGLPEVTCPKYTLTPGEEIVCHFYAHPADKTPVTVYVEAEISNAIKTETKIRWEVVNYDSNANNHIDTSINTPMIDECVTVTDTNKTVALGTVCAGDVNKTFTYTLMFGAHPDADVMLECGENTHENIATFETNDTQTEGSDSAIVTADVACGGGCTLTPGYWKTHSSNGPAPYDSTWAGRESSTFFLSGMTWYQVFWTPVAGNPYYNLAHHYMAAYLNTLNGASVTSDVTAALGAAEDFFGNYGPDTTWTKAQKQLMNGWAYTLDQYNNGYIGPGHCTE